MNRDDLVERAARALHDCWEQTRPPQYREPFSALPPTSQHLTRKGVAAVLSAIGAAGGTIAAWTHAADHMQERGYVTLPPVLRAIGATAPAAGYDIHAELLHQQGRGPKPPREAAGG